MPLKSTKIAQWPQIRFAERGRSMVEVLGTLSIMGILSLVGLKMYHSAVNSHRANELIYEANKRATMVAAQVMAGRSGGQLSVAEFADPAGYHFGVEANPANPNQFNITIEAVDTEVCQKMKNLVGDGTTIRLISPDCRKLTFNNDLSKTVQASDFNGNETACNANGNTWCGGSGLCQQSENCCDGKEIGKCQLCDETGAVTQSAMEGKVCNYTENGNDGICHNGVCEPKNTETNCVAGGPRCNDPTLDENTGLPLYGTCCSAGYLCTTNGDVAGTCMKFGAEIDCTTNADCTQKYGTSKPWCKVADNLTGGTCTALENGVTKTIYGLGEIWASTNKMNWWTAKNWCEAMGKHLVNVEDFQGYLPGSSFLLNAGYYSGYRACAKGKTCCDWSVSPCNRVWNGNTLTDAADTDGTYGPVGELYRVKFSPIFIALAEEFKGTKNVFWTASDAGPDNTGNNVFTADISTCALLRQRPKVGEYALCQ